MRIDRDTAKEILDTLTRNKSRSFLTAFGVFWGIFMLVTLMGGGNGIQDRMKSQFDGFATNSCFMAPRATGEAYQGFRKGRWWAFNNDDIKLLKDNISEIDVVCSTVAKWGKNAIYGDKKYNCNLKGLMPEYNFVEEHTVLYGRFLNDMDVHDKRKVCVLGKRVYEALYDKGVDPCGTYIRFDGVYYRVVGVVQTNGNINIQGNAAEQVLIPINVFQTIYNYGDNIDVVNIKLKDGVKAADIKDKIESLVRKKHYLAPNDQQAILFLDCEAMFSMIDSLFVGIKLLVLIVGLGTLLAGIIGVSNIMMVTVRERTVEIGIRRAIGAHPMDIMSQILAESVVLTILAGAMGVCAGVGLLQVFETLTMTDTGRTFAFQVSFGMALGMMFFVVILGIVAGLAPAYRAMAIKPVDAMRDE